MESIHNVTAEYRSAISNGHRLKVSILAHGMYIDGFTVRESTKAGAKWWVQPPSIPFMGRYKQVVEFNKQQSLWKEIEQACIDCVEGHLNDEEEMTQERVNQSVGEAVDRIEAEESGKAIPWRDYEPD